MEKKRIAYLDALKCLAMLLVIDIHVRSGNGFKSYDTLSAQMIYAPAVPLFFFASGFLAYKQSMSIKDVCDNIRKKFVILVIPALVFRVGMDLMNHNNPIRFLSEGMINYWFTIVLFECFLIYYLITMVVKNEKWRIGVLLCLSMAGIGMLAINRDFGPAIFDLRRLSKYIQFFIIGILAMKFRPKYESLMHNEVFKATFLLSYFIVIFLLAYDMSSVLHLFLQDIMLRYFATFAIVSFFVCHEEGLQRPTRFNSLIALIGQNSLAIYLIHYFFLPHFRPQPEWFAGLNMVTVHIVSILYTIAITGLCLVFIVFLSNSKYIRKYALGHK